MTSHDPIDPRLIAALAQSTGLALPRERVEVVGTALRDLLDLAAGLRQLPLDGVPPAAEAPRWE
jgi:hypothetical protein